MKDCCHRIILQMMAIVLNDFNDYIPFMSYFGRVDFVDQQFAI